MSARIERKKLKLPRQDMLWLIGLLTTLLIYFCFQFSYFNKFLPIQDGWFIEYAKQWNNRKVIYKDFHVFIQPMYVFIFGLISKIFGNNLIYFRYYGILERFFLVLIVFSLFSQLTKPYRAILLTITGLFLFSANTADVIYSYYQLVAIFSFVSAFLIIKYYNNSNIYCILFAGLFAGLAFMTKQSTGVLVPFSQLLMMFILYQSGLSNTRQYLTSQGIFLIGMAIPILIIFFYLFEVNAFSAYWRAVFIDSSSKGNLVDILFKFWIRMFSIKEMIIFAMILICVQIISKIKFKSSTLSNLISPVFNNRATILFCTIGVLALSAAVVLPYVMGYPDDFRILDYIYVKAEFFSNRLRLVYAAFFFNALIIIYYLYKALTKKFSTDDIAIAAISVTSFSFMYAHGLSGFIEPHAAVVSAGLLILWLLERETVFCNAKNLLVYLIILFIVVMSAFEKNAWMYSWHGWDERISWTAKSSPSAPVLKGFALNQDKALIFNDIYDILQKNTKKGDIIYTFPHMPIFYLFSDFRRVTFSAVHYFDVCPDYIAIKDAKTISSIEPKVIIYMDFPEESWKIHEELFRSGNRSGQRNFKELMEWYKKENKYHTLKSYVTSGYNYPLEVLIRN